jgi:hypothetical protein
MNERLAFVLAVAAAGSDGDVCALRNARGGEDKDY